MLRRIKSDKIWQSRQRKSDYKELEQMIYLYLW